MTKEEILKANYPSLIRQEDEFGLASIYEAMEEYAQEQVKNCALGSVVGRGEQLLAFKEWERDKCKLRWDAEPKEIVEQYLSQNVTYYISNRDKSS